ncbi:hypothetical protein A9R00_00290 [Oleispira antarctica]|uniref:Glycosyltransferase RgtA/B/C/D-like domain-containing protein n=1 Tax=Oleispira antarctica TaxID=188908 RepID=A0A1Y5HW77_OLEAN|nr:hypothetical protein A9R00_00290 [Oleispira antarctica]
MTLMNIKSIYISSALLILVTILSTQFELVEDWKATHWVMSYDLEFIKRGAIGSITSDLFTLPISLEQISLAAYCVYFLLSIFLILYVVPAFKDDLPLITLLLSSGFALQQLGYDIGRFDHIVLLLTLVTLKIAPLCKNNPALVTILLILLSALSMLVHEAAALIAIPLTFSALSISIIKNEKSYLCPSVYLASSICIFFAIIIMGSPITSPEQWVAFLQSKADFVINLNSAAVTHNSLQDNILISFERLITTKTANRMLLVFIFSSAYIYIIYRIFQKQLINENRSIAFLTLLPIMATIPLFFLGLDYYRWIALAMLNTLLILTFLRHMTEKKPINASRKTLFILATFTLYAGPLGISIALPDRLMLFRSIHSLF